MTLTLNSFINLILCLHLPALRSPAAIISEKSTVLIYFYAPNFEEVREAYWFGPVRLSVCYTCTRSRTVRDHTRLTMYYIRALIYDFLYWCLYGIVLEALRSVLETLRKYTHVHTKNLY